MAQSTGAKRNGKVKLSTDGPDYGPFQEDRWPADILDGRWLALDSHCWERHDEEDRSQLRARILGGCSSHNACVILRAPDADSARSVLTPDAYAEIEVHRWQFGGRA